MEPANANTALEVIQEDWIGTACYFCYGQCANFGVEGKANEAGIQIRPCSRGIADTVARRRRRENRSRGPLENGERRINANRSEHP
jgi:hypothetical protein